MRRYVYQTPSEHTEAPPTEEELGCSFSTAVLLWTAWRDHGTMAVAGGLLDQPRWWRAVIDALNEHHAPIQQQYMDEQYPERKHAAANASGDHWIEDGEAEMQEAFSFDRLKG